MTSACNKKRGTIRDNKTGQGKSVIVDRAIRPNSETKRIVEQTQGCRRQR